MNDGACIGKDPELWFSRDPVDNAIARRICQTCPVQTPCLEHAVVFREKGMWAGTSERQRYRIRAARRQRAS